MFKVDFSQRSGLSGNDSSVQERRNKSRANLLSSNACSFLSNSYGRNNSLTAKYEKLDLHLFVSGRSDKHDDLEELEQSRH